MGSSSLSGSRNGLAPGISAVFSYSSDEDLGRQLEQLDVNPGAEAGGGPSRPLRGTHFRGALVLGCVQVQPQTGVRTLEQAADEGEVEERRRTSREPARMPALKRQRARGGSEGTN
mmetsp:Transcript_25151/g.58182  ORF Transcript_25151/g.58182 Transcript_25151/m.58182 type:complete len:116 (-) Transcript_25151:203-550(-)